jgi:hypothetical protein
MKSHLNVIKNFIGHFSGENYVVIWFSLHQGKKNHMVLFVLFYIRFGSFIMRDNLVATMSIFKLFFLFGDLVPS